MFLAKGRVTALTPVGEILADVRRVVGMHLAIPILIIIGSYVVEAVPLLNHGRYQVLADQLLIPQLFINNRNHPKIR